MEAGSTAYQVYVGVDVAAETFVAAWLANIFHVPERQTCLLCLGIAVIAGALAWLAETDCARRERRLAAKRLRLVEGRVVRADVKAGALARRTHLVPDKSCGEMDRRHHGAGLGVRPSERLRSKRLGA